MTETSGRLPSHALWLDGAVLREVEDNPGQKGSAVIESFFAVDHIPRHSVAGSIAYLVSHGKLRLDGEQRLWLGGSDA